MYEFMSHEGPYHDSTVTIVIAVVGVHPGQTWDDIHFSERNYFQFPAKVFELLRDDVTNKIYLNEIHIFTTHQVRKFNDKRHSMFELPVLW